MNLLIEIKLILQRHRKVGKSPSNHKCAAIVNRYSGAASKNFCIGCLGFAQNNRYGTGILVFSSAAAPHRANYESPRFHGRDDVELQDIMVYELHSSEDEISRLIAPWIECSFSNHAEHPFMLHQR